MKRQDRAWRFDLLEARDRIGGWLCEAPLRHAPKLELGGVAGRLSVAGEAEFHYGEIAGYWLSWALRPKFESDDRSRQLAGSSVVGSASGRNAHRSARRLAQSRRLLFRSGHDRAGPCGCCAPCWRRGVWEGCCPDCWLAGPHEHPL